MFLVYPFAPPPGPPSARFPHVEIVCWRPVTPSIAASPGKARNPPPCSHPSLACLPVGGCPGTPRGKVKIPSTAGKNHQRSIMTCGAPTARWDMPGARAPNELPRHARSRPHHSTTCGVERRQQHAATYARAGCQQRAATCGSARPDGRPTGREHGQRELGLAPAPTSRLDGSPPRGRRGRRPPRPLHKARTAAASRTASRSPRPTRRERPERFGAIALAARPPLPLIHRRRAGIRAVPNPGAAPRTGRADSAASRRKSCHPPRPWARCCGWRAPAPSGSSGNAVPADRP